MLNNGTIHLHYIYFCVSFCLRFNWALLLTPVLLVQHTFPTFLKGAATGLYNKSFIYTNSSTPSFSNLTQCWTVFLNASYFSLKHHHRHHICFKQDAAQSKYRNLQLEFSMSSCLVLCCQPGLRTCHFNSYVIQLAVKTVTWMAYSLFLFAIVTRLSRGCTYNITLLHPMQQLRCSRHVYTGIKTQVHQCNN